MERAKLQSELKKLGVTYRGLELLEYLKRGYFRNTTGADLQRLRPLIFREARDVKQGVDELVRAEIISANYDKGKITDIVPNIERLLSLEDIGVGITVVKAEPKKKKATDLPDNVKDILLHYNSHATLPRPSTPTPLLVSRIQTKLEVFTPEQIKDALDLAANASWLVRKGSEVWCNAAWVMNALDGFMQGGKYYDGGSSIDSSEKYKIEDDNTEVFW